MIVDTHVHIWEVPPIAPVGPTGPRQAGVLTESAPAELLVEDIDAHGVDWAVIVQTSSSTWDNGYIADSARKHPDRFIAHGMVDPLDPDNATTAAYWMDERGVVGGTLAHGAVAQILRRVGSLATEATENDADEGAIHTAAHDIAEDRARGPDQRPRDDQQRIFQSEANTARCPA